MLRNKFKNLLIIFCVFFNIIIFINPVFAAIDASLNFKASKNSVIVDERFTVDVLVSSPSEAMNASSAIINFPTNFLEAVSISKSGSLISLWVEEPTINNSNGKINYAGVLIPNQFLGKSGKLFTITFRAKAIGKANLTFSSGQVLAHDGSGTNLLSTSSSTAITISAKPVATPLPTPTPKRLNDLPIPEFTNLKIINLPSEIFNGIEAVSYIFDQSENTIPDIIADNFEKPFPINLYSEGIWYFHFRYNDGNWSDTITKKIIVDFSSPKIDVKLEPRNSESERYVKFIISATDEFSGVSKYEIYLDGKLIKTIEKPVFPTNEIYGPLENGDHEFNFKVYDNSGNFSEVKKLVEVNSYSRNSSQNIFDQIFQIGCETGFTETSYAQHEKEEGEEHLEKPCLQQDESNFWKCLVMINLLILIIFGLLILLVNKRRKNAIKNLASQLQNQNSTPTIN